MKKFFLFFVCIFFFSFSSNLIAQVGVNTSDPDESAYLDISGSEKGLLPPRLSTADRTVLDGLGSTNGPATGLVIYNTSVGALQVNQGSKGSPNWVTLGEGGSTPAPSLDFVWYYFPVTPLTMIPTSQDGTVSINLYDIYKSKLETPLGLTYNRSQLTFVILGYDTDSFSSPQIVADLDDNNNLNILQYTPTSSGTSDQAYFNLAVKITN